ncbi:MAG: pyridoxal phosphate-dependent aminotransferase family protein [Candidatus Aminicenantes bacterium]|nr:pyridoxal phosphate-dependent aminotransferase family protein [Candidatus Aminicenantes bacterium]
MADRREFLRQAAAGAVGLKFLRKGEKAAPITFSPNGSPNVPLSPDYIEDIEGLGRGVGWPAEEGQAPSPYGDMFVMESAPGPETVINGKSYVYFGGTGYFALHDHPDVIDAGIEAFRIYGTHSATTRAGFGNNPVLLECERKLADYFGTEDAVHFVSGYFDGLIMAQALADKYDIAFIDETAHFSVRDGIAAARKPFVTFRHRDPEDLGRKLKRELKAGQRPLLMTDGIFPTFGVIAPVPEYVKVMEPYGGIIALDDSHAVGVLGKNGRGTIEHFGLAAGERLVTAGTLSKAFGGHGGFVVGSKALCARIRALGIYSGATPSPTPAVAASIKGIEIVKGHPEMRERLWKNVAAVKGGMRKLGFEMNDTPVPIVTWMMGSAEEMKKAQRALMERGVAVAYLKYVGAPAGGVLRASIFSEHTAGHIEMLLSELSALIKR